MATQQGKNPIASALIACAFLALFAIPILLAGCTSVSNDGTESEVVSYEQAPKALANYMAPFLAPETPQTAIDAVLSVVPSFGEDKSWARDLAASWLDGMSYAVGEAIPTGDSSCTVHLTVNSRHLIAALSGSVMDYINAGPEKGYDALTQESFIAGLKEIVSKAPLETTELDVPMTYMSGSWVVAPEGSDKVMEALTGTASDVVSDLASGASDTISELFNVKSGE